MEEMSRTLKFKDRLLLALRVERSLREIHVPAEFIMTPALSTRPVGFNRLLVMFDQATVEHNVVSALLAGSHDEIASRAEAAARNFALVYGGPIIDAPERDTITRPA